jgi:5-(carboxyamino)imidazole ribonucleotide synthase
MTVPQRLPPGSTIGILGAGQLGRMLALAAAPLGLRCGIYAPESDAPAHDVCAFHVSAPWDDAAALAAFAARCDVVTLEFENVPVETLELLEGLVPVLPGVRSLALTQDRLVEKQFIRKAGLEPAPFAAVTDLASLLAGLEQLGTPAILKTRRLGYDGRGQVVIRSPQEAPEALAAIGAAPAVLEGFVAFEREISVILARRADGAVCTWPCPHNVHEGGILRTSTVPCGLDRRTTSRAQEDAVTLAERLGHVGVMAVEFFVGADGTLTVNEIAPRVHNSGHWTIEGARTSQFEQHIRAVAGWPLGDTSLTGAGARMDNLIGAEAERWPGLAGEPGVHLHLYGKAESRPGRKMGHVTRVT